MENLPNFSEIYRQVNQIKIVWNITKICAWDCSFCCVDATHIKRLSNEAIIRTRCLSKKYKVAINNNIGIYELANKYLVEKGLEINYQDKIDILANIDFDAKIDFSGGDPLLVKENIEIIKKASEKFGKKNISVTATGAGFSKIDPILLSNIVGNVDFTYDSAETIGVPNRPDTYNSSNLRKISNLMKYGIVAIAQIPLTFENMSATSIQKIYMALHNKGIEQALLMRYFQVGRGSILKIQVPSVEEYKSAIEMFTNLEAKYKYPKIKLQSAMQNFIQEDNENSSDYSSTHLMITNLGILSSSPWSVNQFGKPLKKFVLGDLKFNRISNLLQTTKKQDVVIKKLNLFINKAASILY